MQSDFNNLDKNLFILSSIFIQYLWIGSVIEQNLELSEMRFSKLFKYVDLSTTTTPLPLSGADIISDFLYSRQQKFALTHKTFGIKVTVVVEWAGPGTSELGVRPGIRGWANLRNWRIRI